MINCILVLWIHFTEWFFINARVFHLPLCLCIPPVWQGTLVCGAAEISHLRKPGRVKKKVNTTAKRKLLMKSSSSHAYPFFSTFYLKCSEYVSHKFKYESAILRMLKEIRNKNPQLNKDANLSIQCRFNWMCGIFAHYHYANFFFLKGDMSCLLFSNLKLWCR